MPDPMTIAEVEEYLALLHTVPWFRQLGKPHPDDASVVRIHAWDQWLGPEGGYCDWFARWSAFVRECVEADEPARQAELQSLWERVDATVMQLAVPNVPRFDPHRDPWHGPTACVWSAAYTAGLIGWHVLLRRPIGWIIQEQWKWFVAGHWPCDFAEEPVGIDERLVEIPRVRLLVF